MQVIWLIVTFVAVYSKTLLCSPSFGSLSKNANLSSDSDSEGDDARSVTISEESEWENADLGYQNFTDESTGLDEGGMPTDESIPRKLENTKIEVEVTTSNSEILVTENRRKNQPTTVDGTCPNPPSIQHAMVVGGRKPSYDSGAVITYSCEFGYVTDGVVRTAQCTEKHGLLQWTEPEILCIPRSCGEPGFVNNANRIGSLFIFPNSVSFECEDGFKLRGNRIRYCQPSGTWSGTLPTCQKLSCDPPPDIKNGRVFYSSLEYLSELRYECENGFVLRKHQTRVCATNGTWSGDDPVCQDSQCDPPEAPKQGSVQVIGGKASVDSRAIYTCDGDRVLVGSKTSICMETGDWTFPPPKCLDPCSVPEVSHGKIGLYEKVRYRQQRFKELSVGTKVENGDELYLQCENKYNALGKSSTEEHITCNNGEWTDFPRCEPAACTAKPPELANARFGSINRTHGGIVVYYCSDPYTKTQKGNVTCDFGSWKGVTPVCSDTRCYLDTISFPGLVKGSKRIYRSGQSFTPMCESKYTAAIPNNKLTCNSGTWGGHLPPCTAAGCQDEPPSIEHGTYGLYSGLHGSSVSYECDQDFSLKESGSSKIQCLFGKWEGIPPMCKDTRCYQENLQKYNGVVKSDIVTSSGSYLVVDCADGFTSTGVNPYCSNGDWRVPDKPCKENNCVAFEIQNGHFTEKTEKKRKSFWGTIHIETSFKIVPPGQVRSSSSSLHVNCNSPLTFQGKGGNTVEVTCSKGKWVPHPVCLRSGTPFKEVSTSEEETKTTTTRRPVLTTRRSIASKETNLQRNLTDGVENRCTCTYRNLDDKLVAHSGTELLQHETKVKDNCKVKFRCVDIGYFRFKGNKELVCKDCKTWHSSEYPQCDEPLFGDAIIRLDNNNVQPGGLVAIQEGDNIRFVCIANAVATYPQWTTPTSRNLAFTEYIEPNGRWYTVILDIQNANPEHNGKYKCAVGGNRPQAIEIQVMSSGIYCPDIEETIDMAVDFDKGRAVNSSVVFSCKDQNAKLVGSSVLTCLLNGLWSGEPPVCKLKVMCPELKPSDGMSITYSDGLNMNSQATFHCFSPRKRTGQATSKCKRNGQWSNPVPECLLSNCAVEELFRDLPENVISDVEHIQSDTVPYNFTLILKCEEGLILHGSEIARCGEDEKWEVSTFQCIRGCVSLKLSGNSMIIEPEKSVYRIGEFVTLSCPPGEMLSSDVVRLMCLNNGWSETVHCQVEGM